MNKEKILEISKSLKFSIDDKVSAEIEKQAKELEIKFQNLNKINTDNVEPMTRIDATPISFLREDIPKEGLSKELILKNAPSSNEDFVIVKREVSND